MEKYFIAGETIDDKMVHVHCMLDTKGYANSLRICTIIAFPLQKWLQGRASVLHYTHIACLVLR
jgi:hypothetical protein